MRNLTPEDEGKYAIILSEFMDFAVYGRLIYTKPTKQRNGDPEELWFFANDDTHGRSCVYDYKEFRRTWCLGNGMFEDGKINDIKDIFIFENGKITKELLRT